MISKRFGGLIYWTFGWALSFVIIVCPLGFPRGPEHQIGYLLGDK